MRPCGLFFFFNDTATTEIYTLSLHDALPICGNRDRTTSAAARSHGDVGLCGGRRAGRDDGYVGEVPLADVTVIRSEEHTSELQSRSDIVCRLLLEKKKPK